MRYCVKKQKKNNNKTTLELYSNCINENAIQLSRGVIFPQFLAIYIDPCLLPQHDYGKSLSSGREETHGVSAL